MIQLTLYTLSLIFGLIFTQMTHPLAMGIMLLIQTVLVSLISGLMTKSFWFSYILFLIFIGGMLVLFIYVTALASNEMFTFSMKLSIIMFILFFMIICLSLVIDKPTLSLFLTNNDMQSIYSPNSYINENSLNLNKLYNYPTNLITLLLINYLLITLIVVVKITKLFYGPLRSMS